MANKRKKKVARDQSKAPQGRAPKREPRVKAVKRKSARQPTTADAVDFGLSAVAVAAPSGPEECQLWRRRAFRTRIFGAVAEWSREDPATLAPTMTLASLAKGTPWNQGQQNRLLQATNAAQPFEPFDSTMNAPPGLAAGTTTVDQWEQLAWDRQTPRTPCFGLA